MENQWICILAAGQGTRMGSLGSDLPKALIPAGGKAAITRIIESFPQDSHFVVALGHKGEAIKDFLSMAHPNLNFHYVDVDPFSGPGSGPGRSIACCAGILQRPFYLVCCDTFWDEILKPLPDGNWIGVGKVPQNESSSYCNLKVNSNLDVESIYDKKPVGDSSFWAFTGLAFIKDYQEFFAALLGPSDLNKNIQGELQLSQGFEALVRGKTLKAVDLPGWIDIGSELKLNAFREHCEQSKFGKIGESLFFAGDRVIKFFSDASIVRNRIERAEMLKPSVPDICGRAENFYAYNYIKGSTCYEKSGLNFQLLLDWSEENLWKPCSQVTMTEVKTCGLSFYRDKTFKRISQFWDRNPDFPKLNGENLLSEIDWTAVVDFKPVVFHGDFQLDNIIVRENEKSFALIDWRHDFGGSTRFGDLAYDLAKLRSSLEVDFHQLSKGNFSFDPETLEMKLPSLKKSPEYLNLLDEFMKRKGIDTGRVRLLSALVFLNMAGLHEGPLDCVFYLYGCQKMEEWRGKQNAQSAS